MKTEKPEILDFHAQPMEWKKTLYQSCTVTMCVSLKDGSIIPPDEGLAAAMEALPKNTALDPHGPKGKPEWLLAGKAYTEAGSKKNSVMAKISIGKAGRSFLVSSTNPFAEMPLTWENTWGSEKENPDGKKASGIKAMTVTDPALPFGTPACPSPRGEWKCRTEFLGTYDEKWAKECWPGFADDFNPMYFNLAQPYQFFPTPLIGDEEIVLESLNQSERKISAKLPGKKVTMTVFKAGVGKENAIKLDTLWLFPNQMVAMLLWHGLVKSDTELGTDIEKVVLKVTPEDIKPEIPEVPLEAPAPEITPAAALGAAAAVAAAGGGIAAAADSGSGGGSSPTTPAASLAAEEKKEETKEEKKTEEEAEKELQAEQPRTAAQIQAELEQSFDESLPEINEGLASQGVAPFNDDQIKQTKALLSEYSKKLEEIENLPEEETPAPPIDETLRNAGVDEKSIKQFEDALGYELPDPSQYTTQEEWKAAVADSVKGFNNIMPMSSSQTDMMTKLMLAGGPDPEAALKEIAGNPETDAEALLVKAGMKAENAAAFLQALDEPPADESFDALEAHAAEIEKAAGFEAGSMTSKVKEFKSFLTENHLIDENGKIISDEDEDEAQSSEKKKEEEAVEAAEEKAAELESEPEQEATKELTPEELEQQKLAAKQAEFFDVSVDETPAAETVAEATTKPLIDPAKLGADGKPTADVLKSILSSGSKSHSQEEVLLLILGGVSLAGLCFAGAKLAGVNFADQDLKCTDFDDCDLTGASFENSDVSNCTFRRADLTDANFTNAKMNEALLNDAKALRTDFTGAKLTNAGGEGLMAKDSTWDNADLTQSVMKNADFTGANFSNSVAASTDFTNSCFTKASCFQATMPEAVFTGTVCQGTDFHGANVLKADFTDASLNKATFCYGANADGAIFRRANMANATWTDSTAKTADFSGANAKNALATSCDFGGSTWNMADLSSADFSRSSMKASDVRGVNFFETTLRETDFSAANLKGSSLYGADLYRAKVNILTNVDNTDITRTVWKLQGVPYEKG